VDGAPRERGAGALGAAAREKSPSGEPDRAMPGLAYVVKNIPEIDVLEETMITACWRKRENASEQWVSAKSRRAVIIQQNRRSSQRRERSAFHADLSSLVPYRRRMRPGL